MAEGFAFRLITPTGVIFEGPVEEVVGFSPLGEFGVLAQHIDFITALIPGLLTVKSSADHSADYVVIGGLAVVRGGAMTVLAPEVQLPQSLDRGAVANESRTAEERLGQTSYYAAEYAEAKRAMQIARARQRAVELKGPSR